MGKKSRFIWIGHLNGTAARLTYSETDRIFLKYIVLSADNTTEKVFLRTVRNYVRVPGVCAFQNMQTLCRSSVIVFLQDSYLCNAQNCMETLRKKFNNTALVFIL